MVSVSTHMLSTNVIARAETRAKRVHEWVTCAACWTVLELRGKYTVMAQGIRVLKCSAVRGAWESRASGGRVMCVEGFPYGRWREENAAHLNAETLMLRLWPMQNFDKFHFHLRKWTKKYTNNNEGYKNAENTAWQVFKKVWGIFFYLSLFLCLSFHLSFWPLCYFSSQRIPWHWILRAFL